ncbi:MAG TPA: PQQ-binding-like beta-propeller repeat protein [Bacillota bacterium]|nr:PQQ-binding-like beta-propeller repeat protein [Bacillota bacterium]
MQSVFFRVTLALGLIAVIGQEPLARANDWPQWRGPKRDGLSQECGWQATWTTNGPKQLWEGSVGVGYSSFAVSNGRLYTMGNVAEKDTVFCFDALTGKLNWKFEYDSASKDPNGYHGTRCTPTVDGDRVYTLGRHGQFFCLDAAKGDVKWSKDFKKEFEAKIPTWGLSGSPLIERDWVLTETGSKSNASVIAMNKLTGEVAWQAGNDPAGYASLIAFDLAGERCFLQFSAEHLICRKMKDGSELWRTLWKTSYGVNAATPIIQDDEIFVSSGYNYGCALFKATLTGAQELWKNKNMRNHVNSCVLLKGYLYGYDESDLKCLDWKTGEVKWSTKAYGKGALQYAEGKLILYGDKGKLGVAEANPEAFKEISSFQALTGKDTWANPVLANGLLYVRSLEKMLALDVRPPGQS